MTFIEVKGSSQLVGYAYDTELPALYVRFKSGGTHRYLDVTQEHWEGLQAAESKGSYFNTEIRRRYGLWKKLNEAEIAAL